MWIRSDTVAAWWPAAVAAGRRPETLLWRLASTPPCCCCAPCWPCLALAVSRSPRLASAPTPTSLSTSTAAATAESLTSRLWSHVCCPLPWSTAPVHVLQPARQRSGAAFHPTTTAPLIDRAGRVRARRLTLSPVACRLPSRPSSAVHRPVHGPQSRATPHAPRSSRLPPLAIRAQSVQSPRKVRSTQYAPSIHTHTPSVLASAAIMPTPPDTHTTRSHAIPRAPVPSRPLHCPAPHTSPACTAQLSEAQRSSDAHQRCVHASQLAGLIPSRAPRLDLDLSTFPQRSAAQRGPATASLAQTR